jgi:hypothetical protein
MSTAGFELEIMEQGWLDVPDAERDDLCSHGDLRLVIGGRVIAAGDGSGDYTISTSALSLLRTLESDHGRGPRVVPTSLVMHCGMLLMTSCPEGIDWSVSHQDGRVLLADVVKNETERFPGLAAELSEDEYRRSIVAFAEAAKEPFAAVEKSLDESTRAEYEAFWREYDQRLARAAAG